MKRIEVEFSIKGIEKAISELEAYKKRLTQKNEAFVRRLGEIGIPVIDERMAIGKGDSNRAHYTEIRVSGSSNGVVTGSLRLEGKDVVFWEFGAGIYYNNGNTNPKASEFGMGVGTYPGQTHAINPGYWWYKGDDGALHLSYGTEATMPMYYAMQEIIEQVNRIAREVFGNG